MQIDLRMVDDPNVLDGGGATEEHGDQSHHDGVIILTIKVFQDLIKSHTQAGPDLPGPVVILRQVDETSGVLRRQFLQRRLLVLVVHVHVELGELVGGDLNPFDPQDFFFRGFLLLGPRLPRPGDLHFHHLVQFQREHALPVNCSVWNILNRTSPEKEEPRVVAGAIRLSMEEYGGSAVTDHGFVHQEKVDFNPECVSTICGKGRTAMNCELGSPYWGSLVGHSRRYNKRSGLWLVGKRVHRRELVGENEGRHGRAAVLEIRAGGQTGSGDDAVGEHGGLNGRGGGQRVGTEACGAVEAAQAEKDVSSVELLLGLVAVCGGVA
nr:hypothetical protein Iba_chr09dCG2540 [Ipomoea batatas]